LCPRRDLQGATGGGSFGKANGWGIEGGAKHGIRQGQNRQRGQDAVISRIISTQNGIEKWSSRGEPAWGEQVGTWELACFDDMGCFPVQKDWFLHNSKKA